MDMSGFWSQVPDSDKLTLADMRTKHAEAFNSMEDEDGDADFAFSVIPAVGPGGLTSDDDEEDYGDNDDNGPSACGEKSLMYYRESVDELYTWNEDSWVLWNF